jgi:Cdc6-like AAA superfamily ATPase
MIINKDNKKCDLCFKNKYYLKDKDDNIYPLITRNHIVHVLDSNNYDVLDRLDEFINKGFSSFRLDLFEETKEELENIIKVIRYAYERRNNK